MDEKEIRPFIRCVMDYIKCNEGMAKTILSSALKNGEFEGITNMCSSKWKERRTGDE